MAEVTGGRGGGQVVRTGTLPVPAGAVENGLVHEIDTVGRAMREFAGAERGKTPQAVVSIPGRRAIIKRLQVACRETDDLDRVIEFEAMDAIPEELDNVRLDYHVVGPSENGDGLEVMLVAARNTLVASYVDLMEAAGLAAAVVDVDHFALRSGSAPGPEDNAQGNVRVLVHVGACSTIIHIPAEASPGHTTDLPLGGEQFTEDLAGRLRVPRDEAEAVKCDAPAGEVAGLLDTLCDEFAARVARGLNLLGPAGRRKQPAPGFPERRRRAAAGPRTQPGADTGCGGSARGDPFSAADGRTRTPTEGPRSRCSRAWSREVPTSRDSSARRPATGQGLHEEDSVDVTIRINLLATRELRALRRKRRTIIAGAAALCLAAVTLAAGNVLQLRRQTALEAELAEQRTLVAGLRRETGAVKAVEERIQQQRQRNQAVESRLQRGGSIPRGYCGACLPRRPNGSG